MPVIHEPLTDVTYTWSRTAPNPVEHIADPDWHSQPLCGRDLSVATQYIGDRPGPSGFAPVCQRCQRKARRNPVLTPRA